MERTQETPLEDSKKEKPFPSASLHRKTSKKQFTADLLKRYPNGVVHDIAYEDNHDGDYHGQLPQIKLWLFYNKLTTPDKHGDDYRHCGTWTRGEGWEFVEETETKGE